MEASIKFALVILSALSISTPTFAQNTKEKAAPTIKPMPKEMLKKLTITFDANGRPVFSPKKKIKAIQCDPATTHIGTNQKTNLPACGPTSYASALDKKQISGSASLSSNSAQVSDTQCYTIFWEQDGIIYSYTYCWDSAASQ